MNNPMRKKTLKRLSLRKKGITGTTKRRQPTRLTAFLTLALLAENLQFETNALDIILVDLGRASVGPTGDQDSGTRVANGPKLTRLLAKDVLVCHRCERVRVEVIQAFPRTMSSQPLLNHFCQVELPVRFIHLVNRFYYLFSAASVLQKQFCMS